jgi:peptidoglycan/LPS O-acetylase OafA/YrhL
MIHLLISAVLLYLRLEGVWGSYALALMPIFSLSVEMVLITLVPLIIILMHRKGKTFQATQNLMIALLVCVSLLIAMFGLFRGEIRGWQAALPLFVIQTIIMIKIGLKREDGFVM